MTKLVKIEFVDFGPCKVVGKSIVTRGLLEGENPIPNFWNKCFCDGTLSTLEGMEDYIDKDMTDEGYVGGMYDYDATTQKFVYIIGMFMKPNCPIPEGFTYYDIPKCKIAKAWVEGEESKICCEGFDLVMKAINDNGYKCNNFNAEVYTCSRFATPSARGDKTLILDYYMEVSTI